MIKLSSLLEEIEQEKVIADKIKQLEHDLEREFPQIQDLHIFLKSNGSLYIQAIRIKQEERRKGIGSQIMDRIKNFADENGLSISLAPEPESRYKEKLYKFYKNHGFVFNKGRHKDWRLSEPFSLSMYRRPKVKEVMDTPTAIVQPNQQHSFDKSFLDYVKYSENETRVGYDKNKKLWFPYAKAEAGNVVIAYGHKSEGTTEANRLKKGITDQEAENLLRKDLEEARVIVNKYIKDVYKTNLILDKNQIEMLVDFTFNMGRPSKFPKFLDAVLRKNWDVAKKEYKRFGGGKELKKRNESFFNRYLKNL